MVPDTNCKQRDTRGENVTSLVKLTADLRYDSLEEKSRLQRGSSACSLITRDVATRCFRLINCHKVPARSSDSTLRRLKTIREINFTVSVTLEQL